MWQIEWFSAGSHISHKHQPMQLHLAYTMTYAMSSHTSDIQASCHSMVIFCEKPIVFFTRQSSAFWVGKKDILQFYVQKGLVLHPYILQPLWCIIHIKLWWIVEANAHVTNCISHTKGIIISIQMSNQQKRGESLNVFNNIQQIGKRLTTKSGTCLNKGPYHWLRCPRDSCAPNS